MINAVLCGLPGHWGSRHVWRPFQVACWGADVEPEFADVTSYDSRADGVDVVPTIRIYDDADPYGEPVLEHKGAADADKISALLTEAKTLV
ncbi:thioredoxin [Streptomyces phage Vash]|uniref:Thioredoxin n=1 Tax=Streptomyces phage Vash TaxID=2510568 RepID=A0A411AYW1_9CAUD|nr:thioredoxin [Streptomyces phage Vash]QAX93299.1 thioredoxin [Streptomyces phage Vash]